MNNRKLLSKTALYRGACDGALATTGEPNYSFASLHLASRIQLSITSWSFHCSGFLSARFWGADCFGWGCALGPLRCVPDYPSPAMASRPPGLSSPRSRKPTSNCASRLPGSARLWNTKAQPARKSWRFSTEQPRSCGRHSAAWPPKPCGVTTGRFSSWRKPAWRGFRVRRKVIWRRGSGRSNIWSCRSRSRSAEWTKRSSKSKRSAGRPTQP